MANPLPHMDQYLQPNHFNCFSNMSILSGYHVAYQPYVIEVAAVSENHPFSPGQSKTGILKNILFTLSY